MKIKVRYENEYQTLEVENMKLEQWLNISISEEISQEDYEKRIQDVIEERFNRPDYNSWHKHTCQTGNAKMKNKEGVIEVNTEEAIMAKAIHQSIFTRDIDGLEERMDHEWQYKHYCSYVREILKPDAAEMVIAIVLDGMTVAEYAEQIGDTPINVSHRYRRAIKKLEKVFEKRSSNAFLKATR